MLDQLSGYAQTLFDTSARRGKAADAPDFSKEQPSNPYGVVGGEYAAAAAAAIEAFDMAKVPAGSVQEALVKLFNSYDTQKKGVLSLETFYQVRACACVSTCNARALLSLTHTPLCLCACVLHSVLWACALCVRRGKRTPRGRAPSRQGRPIGVRGRRVRARAVSSAFLAGGRMRL